MAMTKADQHRALDEARRALLEWAQERLIPLAEVQFVPFFAGQGTKTLAAWLFYDNEEQVSRLGLDGTTDSMQRFFLDSLRAAGVDDAWLAGVTFVVDSKEDVDRDYEGSYFYRMR